MKQCFFFFSLLFLRTSYKLSARTIQGNIGLRSWQQIPSIGRSVQKRPKAISTYTLSNLDYSSNLIGSLSPAIAALFTRYRVDDALSHQTKTKWPASTRISLAFLNRKFYENKKMLNE